MNEIKFRVWVNSADAGEVPGYARVSVPLERGWGEGELAVRVHGGDGVEVPSQWERMGVWPDGSVRMVHVIFGVRGHEAQVVITRGAKREADRGKPGVAGVEFGVEESGSGVRFINGEEAMLLSGEGEEPVPLRWETAGGEARFRGIDLDGEGTPLSWEAEGAPRVLAKGPVYGRVERDFRLTGSGGERHLRVRLTLEGYAGVPGWLVRLRYRHDVAGASSLHARELGLRLEWPERATQARLYQQWHGFEYLESRAVDTTEEFEVVSRGLRAKAHVDPFTVLRDDTGYPHYLKPPPDDVEPVLVHHDDQHWWGMEMEGFLLYRPKSLRSRDGGMEWLNWPQWAGPLDWPQGRSRETTLVVASGVGDPGEHPTRLRQVTAALTKVHRAVLDPEVYAQTGFFDQPRVLAKAPERNPRWEGWVDSLSSILTHADYFNAGDTPDRHYQTGSICLRRVDRVRGLDHLDPPLHTTDGSGFNVLTQLDEFEPFWVNNEYDVVFCLGTEFLRTMDMNLWRKLRLYARHTMEVDFVAYSDHPCHDQSQPAHSPRHTTTGAYPSHFWTQGLAQYYLISGDPDALEVILGLADKTIWYFDHPVLGARQKGINREMGWSILSLLGAYQVTGEAKYRDYALGLLEPVLAEPLPREIPHLAFGHTSLLLGIREWIELLPDHPKTPALRKWFLDIVRISVDSAWRGPVEREEFNPEGRKATYSYDASRKSVGEAGLRFGRPGVLTGYAALDCLAYAYEITGDPDHLHAGLRTLEAFCDGTPGYFQRIFNLRIHLGEGKSFATLYRTIVSYLGALDRAGLLAETDFQYDRSGRKR